MQSIVTRTGDKGQTGLYGAGRISKSHPRIHAYGTVDELCALFGAILAGGASVDFCRGDLIMIQRFLFRIGSDLATPLTSSARIERVSDNDVQHLEAMIDQIESSLPPLTRFILPGGSRTGSQIHIARAVCRRAERWVVALGETEPINEQTRIYLNRLSDYLFLLARMANENEGVQEKEV